MFPVLLAVLGSGAADATQTNSARAKPLTFGEWRRFRGQSFLDFALK